MNPSRKRIWSVWLWASAALAFAIGCEARTAATVVQVTDETITVRDQTTVSPTTYRVPADAVVIKDGQQAGIEEIEPGDSVQVTAATDENGEKVAQELSVTSSEASQEPAFDEQPDEPLPEEPLQPFGEEQPQPIEEEQPQAEPLPQP